MLVTGERRGQCAATVFAHLRAVYGENETALSTVTLVELAHGSERAKTEAQGLRRQEFLDDLIADITVYPLTTGIARLPEKSQGSKLYKRLSSHSRIS